MMTLATFQPRLDVLPAAQRRLWDELSAAPGQFVLRGGTAIALRLAHRQSEDFDFFSNRPFLPLELLKRLPYLNQADVVQESQNTLECVVDRGGPVRLSFFGGLDLNRVADPEIAAGSTMRVASLLDLAATKLAVVVQRASLKDYRDLDALLAAGIELPRALAAARAVYGPRFNPVLSLKALTFFDEGDVKDLDEKARGRLVDAVRAVDIESLPEVAARNGLA